MSIITNAELATYALWSLCATAGMAVLTLLSWIFSWGFRFRLVGVTGFMGVLTVGIWGLSLGLTSRALVPGAIRYTLVYDNGSNLTVIAVAPTVTPDQAEATLQQAAQDLFSPGRIGMGDDQFSVRLRTLIHPETGLSEPVYLGLAQRSLSDRQQTEAAITLDRPAFKRLPAA